MEYKDYYKILGVERNATQDDIKRAYRKLARTYHPDVNKEAGAEAKFKDAGEAYEVLKDPEKRAAYNELGANWKQGQDFRPPPELGPGLRVQRRRLHQRRQRAVQRLLRGPVRPGASGGGRGGRGGFSGRREYSAQGEDHHAKVVIDLRDAYTGAKRDDHAARAGGRRRGPRRGQGPHAQRHHPQGRARGPAHSPRRPGLARHRQGPARRSLSRDALSRPIRCSGSKARTSISTCR